MKSDILTLHGSIVIAWHPWCGDIHICCNGQKLLKCSSTSLSKMETAACDGMRKMKRKGVAIEVLFSVFMAPPERIICRIANAYSPSNVG